MDRNCGNGSSVYRENVAALVLSTSALVVLDLAVVLGNGLVIVAVLADQKLRSVNTLFITSLAVADILVGLFVLPFSTANEILDQRWVFGEVWCQLWLAVDVWLCTASIYNLVAISLDRYLAIMKPLSYRSIMTMRRGYLAVLAAWAVSFVISFPPMVFTWPEAFRSDRPPRCECSPMGNSPGYVIYSSFGSFFLPMATVIFIYVRIYIVARDATNSAFTGMLKVPSTNGNSESGYSPLRIHTRSTKYGSIVSNNNNSLLEKPAGLRPPLRPLSPQVPREKAGHPTQPCSKGRQYRSNSTSPRVFIKNNSNSSMMALLPAERFRGRSSSSTRSEGKSLSVLVEHDNGSGERKDPKSEKRNSSDSQGSTSKSLQKALISPDSPSFEDSSKAPLWDNRENPTPMIRQRRPSSSPVERKLMSTLLMGQGAQSRSDEKIEKSCEEFPKPKSHRKSLLGTERFKNFRQKRFMDKMVKAKQSRLSLELKAAKTVAVVTGCFICCWLGFAIVYFLQAFPHCSDNPECIPQTLFTIFFWLGYANSALNPLIYAVFNRKFRRAFHELLTCRKFREKRRRQRELLKNDGRNSSAKVISQGSFGLTEFRNFEAVTVV